MDTLDTLRAAVYAIERKPAYDEGAWTSVVNAFATAGRRAGLVDVLRRRADAAARHWRRVRTADAYAAMQRALDDYRRLRGDAPDPLRWQS